MHWIKGSPADNESQGEYREMTFFEQVLACLHLERLMAQVDGGRPWTWTKKGLMIMPSVIFAMASISSDYNSVDLLINFPIWFVLIVGKLPELHGVRLFGINATVGIDDAWKASAKKVK